MWGGKIEYGPPFLCHPCRLRQGEGCCARSRAQRRMTVFRENSLRNPKLLDQNRCQFLIKLSGIFAFSSTNLMKQRGPRAAQSKPIYIPDVREHPNCLRTSNVPTVRTCPLVKKLNQKRGMRKQVRHGCPDYCFTRGETTPFCGPS